MFSGQKGYKVSPASFESATPVSSIVPGKPLKGGTLETSCLSNRTCRRFKTVPFTVFFKGYFRNIRFTCTVQTESELGWHCQTLFENLLDLRQVRQVLGQGPKKKPNWIDSIKVELKH